MSEETKEIKIRLVAAEKGLDLIKDVFESMLKPATDAIGQIIASPLQMIAFNRQINNLKKVEKNIREKGLTTKNINSKVLFPYLQGIALEENEKLQDMYANLITNYIDANKNLTITVYPSILQQLSTHEVVLLEYVLNQRGYVMFTGNDDIEVKNVSHAMVANLERLGLLINSSNIGNFITDEDLDLHFKSATYHITPFATEFLFACGIESNIN
jgi:hypothetical protein